MFDLIIDGGYIITMDPENRLIENGAIGIKEDKIVKIGRSQDFEGMDCKKRIDAKDKIIMPGLVDAHGHSGHGLTKTIGSNLKEEGWLRLMEYIYFENSTEDFWRAEALLSGAERIKFGTTTGFSILGSAPRCDDPIYAERHVEAMKETGMRNIIGIGPCKTLWPKRFVRWNGDKVEKEISLTLKEALETTRKVLDKFQGKDDLSFVHVSPSGIGRNMAGTLEEVQYMFKEMKKLASEYNTMINAHAYKGDIKFAHEYLDGILGPNTLLGHVTGVGPEEIKLLADSGTHVSSSPSSRSYVRERCPVPEMLDAGVNVVFTTDGTSPDRTYDLFKDIKVGMLQHRSHFNDVTYIPPGKALKMVTIDAAKALGLDSIIGSLVPGKKADIILIDMQSPHLVPKILQPTRVAYETTGHDVHTVVIDGKVVMENRILLTVNEEEVINFAQEEAEKVIERGGLSRIKAPYEGKEFWEASKFTSIGLEEYIKLPD